MQNYKKKLKQNKKQLLMKTEIGWAHLDQTAVWANVLAQQVVEVHQCNRLNDLKLRVLKMRGWEKCKKNWRMKERKKEDFKSKLKVWKVKFKNKTFLPLLRPQMCQWQVGDCHKSLAWEKSLSMILFWMKKLLKEVFQLYTRVFSMELQWQSKKYLIQDWLTSYYRKFKMKLWCKVFFVIQTLQS